jgi:hypothetical protein
MAKATEGKASSKAESKAESKASDKAAKSGNAMAELLDRPAGELNDLELAEAFGYVKELYLDAQATYKKAQEKAMEYAMEQRRRSNLFLGDDTHSPSSGGGGRGRPRGSTNKPKSVGEVNLYEYTKEQVDAIKADVLAKMPSSGLGVKSSDVAKQMDRDWKLIAAAFNVLKAEEKITLVKSSGKFSNYIRA